MPVNALMRIWKLQRLGKLVRPSATSKMGGGANFQHTPCVIHFNTPGNIFLIFPLKFERDS